MKNMNLQTLYGLWDLLSGVALSDDGALLEPFMHMPAGTPCEDVYRWFESQNAAFSVGEVMQGIRKQIDSFVVVSTEELSDRYRVLVHGVRYDKRIALALAAQVVTDLKAAIEADLKSDLREDFVPLTTVSAEEGFKLISSSGMVFATVLVRFTPACTTIGHPYYSEPLAEDQESPATVAVPGQAGTSMLVSSAFEAIPFAM